MPPGAQMLKILSYVPIVGWGVGAGYNEDLLAELKRKIVV